MACAYHALTTDGAFTPDGTYIPLPDDVSTTPCLKIWESKEFKLLLAKGRITQELVGQTRSWGHSGCSVDGGVALEAGDTAGLERLAASLVPFSFPLLHQAPGSHRCPLPRRRNAISYELVGCLVGHVVGRVWLALFARKQSAPSQEGSVSG